MVLVKKLAPEEIERHEKLIRECFQKLIGEKSPEISLIDNGNNKGVYRVNGTRGNYLAAAANRDSILGAQSLLEEYNILHRLYEGAPDFFPEPYAHYRSSKKEIKGDLILMEFLPHLNIMKFVQENNDLDRRRFAYLLGDALTRVNSNTGRYPSDPHDGNILLKKVGENLELKFCDAIQFKTGSLEDGIRAILVNSGERPESTRFIHKFRGGIINALESEGISSKDAEQSLEFMREYNDIF